MEAAAKAESSRSGSSLDEGERQSGQRRRRSKRRVQASNAAMLSLPIFMDRILIPAAADWQG